MNDILEKLAGGDLRSIGKANEVVQDVIDNPELFPMVFKGTLSEDPIIRMRSADVIEKVSSVHPEYLQPFKTRLINEVAKVEQKEVQWHIAQMFGYIEVTKEERDKIIEILQKYVQSSESKIVVTFSLQTLADFALKHESIRPKIIRTIEVTIQGESPAIVNRGKKLLKKLGQT